MSTDWNVYCVDCDSTERFNDANHAVDLMRILIKHAKAIGALDALVSEYGIYSVELRTPYGNVSTSWFKEHADHRLIPRNEYGGYDDDCNKRVKCADCDVGFTCVRVVNHEGKCARTRPKEDTPPPGFPHKSSH